MFLNVVVQQNVWVLLLLNTHFNQIIASDIA